ncbi:MAG: Hsp33 family molecular chaperone HslO [Faecalibacterium sp.]|nr:Hsp33 family molecular chaperone HslO [Faecalibacterium sp.]
MANMIRGLSENGGVVFCGVDSTEIVREAERIHKTSATCSAALGRLLTGASMMGMMQKDASDRITLRMKGDGPAGSVIAVADGFGIVKGCIDYPQADLPTRADGHLDVSGVIGHDGILTVIRDNVNLHDPYVGQIPFASGEVAEDLTHYYAVSEQVPTVCALGVYVDTDLSIVCAGGYLLQLLPGATDEEITQLEKNIAAMPSVTEMLRAGKTPEDMMMMAMEGFNPNVLDEHTVSYRCDCSRERTEAVLIGLGRKELERMRDEEPSCEVVCHFCNKKYQFDLNEILEKVDREAENKAE